MAYFFMSNTVMAYQRFRHMGCCQNTPQRMLLFQVSRRTDTGKHRCIHITQKESHILLLHGKTRRQLHCCRGFTRSRTSPDCQHLILIFRFPVRRAVPGSPAENTVFQKIQGLLHLAFLCFALFGLLLLLCFGFLWLLIRVIRRLVFFRFSFHIFWRIQFR